MKTRIAVVSIATAALMMAFAVVITGDNLDYSQYDGYEQYYDQDDDGIPLIKCHKTFENDCPNDYFVRVLNKSFVNGIAVWGESYGGVGIKGTGDLWGGYFEGNGYFSGNVGIGTKTPDSKLQVAGGSILNYWSHTNDQSPSVEVSNLNGDFGSMPGKGTCAIWGAATSDETDFKWGIKGVAGGGAGTKVGVCGHAFGPGTNWAGYFTGDVYVDGDIYKTGSCSFVEEHPQDPTKEVVYVCLEGGEVGTYVRGEGQLMNGEAEIELPEHFSLVTSETGLTCQITPLGDCNGLRAAALSNASLWVKELNGGTSNARFYYLVNGVRKGYENYNPIREKSESPVLMELSH